MTKKAKVTPWWGGITCDHLYWYCPSRSTDITRDEFRDNPHAYGPVTLQGLDPYGRETCSWCSRRYNRSIPRTEGGPDTWDALSSGGWTLGRLHSGT